MKQKPTFWLLSVLPRAATSRFKKSLNASVSKATFVSLRRSLPALQTARRKNARIFSMSSLPSCNIFSPSAPAVTASVNGSIFKTSAASTVLSEVDSLSALWWNPSSTKPRKVRCPSLIFRTFRPSKLSSFPTCEVPSQKKRPASICFFTVSPVPAKPNCRDFWPKRSTSRPTRFPPVPQSAVKKTLDSAVGKPRRVALKITTAASFSSMRLKISF